MCIDMFIDRCIDTCIDTCVDMCIGWLPPKPTVVRVVTDQYIETRYFVALVGSTKSAGT